MKFLKKSQKILVCFEAQELITLLLSKDLKKILKLTTDNLDNLKNVGQRISQLVTQSTNSKDYELWTGVFSLYEEFERNCEFCFYLKDTFNPKKDTIITFTDLLKFKQDPPDIVVYHRGSFFEFELKRYRDSLSENNLLAFISKKIINYYSDPYNFLIILQPKPHTFVSLNIFKALHENVVQLALKRNIGKIAFSFNQNNKEMIFVTVFPKLAMHK